MVVQPGLCGTWSETPKTSFLIMRLISSAQEKGKDSTETDMSNKHYSNISVQYTAIFYSCKNDNFQIKFFDVFLIFAQNMDCGYSLEPPQ